MKRVVSELTTVCVTDTKKSKKGVVYSNFIVGCYYCFIVGGKIAKIKNKTKNKTAKNESIKNKTAKNKTAKERKKYHYVGKIYFGYQVS